MIPNLPSTNYPHPAANLRWYWLSMQQIVRIAGAREQSLEPNACLIAWCNQQNHYLLNKHISTAHETRAIGAEIPQV